MRRGLAILVAVSALGLAPKPARCQGYRDTASKLLALESAWNQAEEKGDIHALELILDDSLVYIEEDGNLLTKVQFLKKTAKHSDSDLWLATPTMRVQVFGDTAIVVGTYRLKGTRQGRHFQRDGRFIDTWALKKGNWVCVAAQSTPSLAP